jgi:hypothetical protein
MPEITVADLVAQRDVVNLAAQQAMSQIQTNATKSNAAGIAIAEDQIVIGAANAVIVGTEQAKEAGRQARAASIAASFGGDPNAPNEAFSALGQEYIKRTAEYEKSLKEVARRQQVGFFDDPAEYIVNQFGGINDAIHEANKNELLAESSKKTMDQLNNSVQQMTVTSKATLVTKNEATTAAAVDVVKATADIAANQTRMVNAKNDTENILALQKLTTEQLTTNFHLFGAANAAEDLKIKQANLALHTKQVDATLAEHKVRMEAKEEDTVSKQFFANTINAGRARSGLAPMTVQEIESRRKLGGAAAKKLEEMFTYGDQVKSTGNTIYAADPSSSLYRMQTMGALPTEAQRPMLDAIKAVTSPIVNGMKPKNQAELNAAVDKTKPAVAEFITGQRTVINGTDKGANIFAAVDPLTIVQMVPAVAELPFYQHVIAPRIVDGKAIPTDPKQFAGTAIAELASGGPNALTYNQVVNGLPAYFKAAAGVNNATMKYTDLGIQKQDSYTVSLPLRGDMVKVNLMDNGQWSYYVAQKLTENLSPTQKSIPGTPALKNEAMANYLGLPTETIELLPVLKKGK